jgi:hypothetical protein
MTSIERACSAAAVAACLLSSGCSLSPVPSPTQPSGVTQQLLMRSLERALAQLDIERLQRQTITIEVFHQAGPEVLIKEFVTASVLGTDTDQDLFGIPAFQAPVVNVPVPEIALFKWQRSRGVAEVRLFEFDGKTDMLVDAPPVATGRAKLDKFTVLIFFGYTETDVDKHD